MLDIKDREFISKEIGRHVSGSEARLMATMATMATKDDLAQEIESLAAMTQRGFDEASKETEEVKYRLGKVESKLDAVASTVSDHAFDIAKLKNDADRIKHHIGLP